MKSWANPKTAKTENNDLSTAYPIARCDYVALAPCAAESAKVSNLPKNSER